MHPKRTEVRFNFLLIDIKLFIRFMSKISITGTRNKYVFISSLFSLVGIYINIYIYGSNATVKKRLLHY